MVHLQEEQVYSILDGGTVRTSYQYFMSTSPSHPWLVCVELYSLSALLHILCARQILYQLNYRGANWLISAIDPSFQIHSHGL